MQNGSAKHFVPYEDLDDTPNIIVDGAGNDATLIALSHWPHSGCPHALLADTSTEIVFNYLEAPDFHVGATAVSNNHFDEDGLAGLYALLEPEAALARRDLLVDVARAGDFATYGDRRAARIAFTISAFADKELSPLDPAHFDLTYGEKVAAIYRELLPRLPAMLDDTDAFRAHWQAEDAVLSDSEAAVDAGDVTIEERPEADLALVRVPHARLAKPVHRFTWRGAAACHPMAIHNRTARNRILVQQGKRYDLTYRYESWVQVTSHRPPPRVGLEPLAETLSSEEPGAARWRFDGVGELTPRLSLDGAAESAIPPEVFSEAVCAFLARADAAGGPPDWDPYANA